MGCLDAICEVELEVGVGAGARCEVTAESRVEVGEGGIYLSLGGQCWV
jgi:hypothetical protein